MADIDEEGYTEDMLYVSDNIATYNRFLVSLIRLDIMPIRHGQILSANHSQQLFKLMRDDSEQ